MYIKKKRLVRAVTYISAVLAVGFGLFFAEKNRFDGASRSIETGYRRSIGELIADVNDIDTALEKAVCCSSDKMLREVCMQIYGKALAAKAAMACLPLYDSGLEQTSSFVSTVGDYAFYASSGTGDRQQAVENLAALHSSASVLSEKLETLASQLLDMQILTSSFDAETASPCESFKQIETEFPEIPSLIYDGPFSQHILSMTPKLTENEEEISAEEALSVCEAMTGIRASAFNVNGVREGNLPVYMISAPVDGGYQTFEITVRGGHVLSMRSSASVGGAVYSCDDAAAAASEFLSENLDGAFEPTYYTANGDTVLFNFAYSENGVIVYPDLVKIEVSLYDLSVTRFDTTGFVMNHTDRTLPYPAVSADEARGHVSPSLKILSERLAIIPTAGKYEKLCREFKCESADGRHYISYINAENGNEEKILILLEDENGTLVI